MRAKKIYTAFLAMTLAVAIALAGVTFAWFYNGDDIRGITYSIAKIDSSVTLFRAIDSNTNGIPDLLAQTESYPHYYMEKYIFEKLGEEGKEEVFATADDTNLNLLTPVAFENIFPTQVYTLKYALINRSTADNVITFKLEDTVIDADTAALMSTFSMRLGIVESSDPSATATVTFGEKVFLCDSITGTSFQELIIPAYIETVEIDAMVGLEKPSNHCDFWLQIEMEAYENIIAHNPAFSMTEEEYNSLQGKSVNLPNLYIYFEIVYEETPNA